MKYRIGDIVKVKNTCRRFCGEENNKIAVAVERNDSDNRYALYFPKEDSRCA